MGPSFDGLAPFGEVDRPTIRRVLQAVPILPHAPGETVGVGIDPLSRQDALKLLDGPDVQQALRSGKP